MFIISKRVYKDKIEHEKAIEIMKEGRGTHFDPYILDAFLELQKEFEDVAKSFIDIHPKVEE